MAERDLVVAGVISLTAGTADRGVHAAVAGTDVERTRVIVVAGSVVRRADTLISDVVATVGRAGNAVIADDGGTGLTITVGITDFSAVAELTVIAKRIIRHVRAHVRIFIAHVDGTSDAVVTDVAVARLAVKCRIANFHAVAELTVAAQAVVRRIVAGIGRLVAGIYRTADAVIAVRRGAALAIIDRIADFDTIAEAAVVADGIIRRIHAGFRLLVTRVDRAAYAVVTVDRDGSLATVDRIADLRTVTEHAVVTEAVIRRIRATAGFVAHVNRAGDAVIAIGRRAGLAVVNGIADFHAVTLKAVAASRIVRQVVARIGVFVAGVDRTRDAVIAVRCHTGLTIVCRIADFNAVTELTIGTDTVIRRVVTRVGVFVAGINRAAYAVIAVGRRARLAVIDRVANFDTVTELAVGADAVIRRVVAGVGVLVAGINRATDAVIAIRCHACLAIVDRIADFHTVTVQPVGANTVVRRVVTGVGVLVAGIDRATYAVITVGRRTRNAAVAKADFDAVAVVSVIALTVGQAVYALVFIFVATQWFSARLGAVLAVIDRVADFVAVTIKTIVAEVVVGRILATLAGNAHINRAVHAVVAKQVDRRVGAGVTHFIAGIFRAIDAVIAVGCHAGLAIVGRVAGFDPVTVIAVVTQAVIRRIRTAVDRVANIDGTTDGVIADGINRVVCARVGTFVTRVGGAIDTIVAVWRHTRLAIVDRITCFDAVAEQAVVAESVVGHVRAGVGIFVTCVVRAAHAVVTIDRHAGFATVDRAAGFDAVAIQAVVTDAVVGRVDAIAGDRIARVDRARNAVIAVRRGAGLAVVGRVADLDTIARHVVITQCIDRSVCTFVVYFVATVVRAADAVVTVDRRTRLAVVGRVAGFNAVAIRAIVAQGIVRHVVARVGRFVTGVNRAADAVIAVRRCAGLAIVGGVAGFDAVTVSPVVAQCVVRHVVARVGRFVAGVNRAADAVIAVRRGAGLAIIGRVARFDAVAMSAVVTDAVVRRVIT